MHSRRASISTLSRLPFVCLTICILYLSFGCADKKPLSEADYSKIIQTYLGGELEKTVPGGRVDLVTSDTAYEIEWANKWKHSMGQAIWYSLQTQKDPGIILILRDSEDYKYYVQLNSALAHAKIQSTFDVLVYPNDF